MGSFEDRDTSVVVDVGTRSDTDTTYLSGQCITDVVTVKVHGRNYAVLFRAQDDLLQEGISNNIFNDDFAAVYLDYVPWSTVEFFTAKFFSSYFVTPIAESTFGKLHDVTLVYQRNTVLTVVDSVLNSSFYQTASTFSRSRLDTETSSIRETNFFVAVREGLLDDLLEFVSIFSSFLELDTSVDILGVFTEDDHIYKFRMLHWARYTLEVLYRTHTSIQVQFLTQGNIQ